VTTSWPGDERVDREPLTAAALEEVLDEAVARLFAIGLDINLALPYLSGLIAERLTAARADAERLARVLREDVLPAAAGSAAGGEALGALPRKDDQLAFLALARHEVRVAERDGTPLELLYLAVDHADVSAGAADVLADVLVNGCRASDVVARWSDTAFVVLMRGTGTTEASEVAYRLHEAYTDCEGQRLQLSVGVVRRTAGEGLEALVARAEEQVAQLQRTR